MITGNHRKFIPFVLLCVFIIATSCSEQQNTEPLPHQTDSPEIKKENTENVIIDTIKPVKMSGFKFWGNEPFWNLKIQDSIIMLFIMAEEKNYEFKANRISEKGNKYIYEAINNEKEKIKIEIKKDQCEDDMSGEPFEYAVIIYLNNEKLEGCGKLID